MWSKYSIWDKLHILAICTYAFFLPYGGMLHSWAVVTLFLMWLIHPSWNDKYQMILSNKWLWCFAAYYVIQWIGLLYSTNIGNAWFKIEQKTALLLVPLALSSSILMETSIKKIVAYSFVSSAFLSVVVNNIWSASEYVHSGENGYFFYSSFSHFIHPAYYSLILSIAILFFIHMGLMLNEIKIRSFVIFMSLVLILGVFQCASKAGLLAFLLIPVFYGRIIIKRFQIPSNIVITILSCLLAVMATTTYLFRDQLRLTNIKFITQEINSDESNLESNGMRIVAWRTSWLLIVQHPFAGYGTGDVADVLDKEYVRQGIHSAAEHSLNSHNQYLQSTLSQGIFGLLLLCLIISFFIDYALRNQHTLLMAIIVIIAFNFLFESMLETRSGLVIFSYVLPLALYYSPSPTRRIAEE